MTADSSIAAASIADAARSRIPEPHAVAAAGSETRLEIQAEAILPIPGGVAAGECRVVRPVVVPDRTECGFRKWRVFDGHGVQPVVRRDADVVLRERGEDGIHIRPGIPVREAPVAL